MSMLSFNRADPDAMTMKLRLSIPELRITGQYKTSGRIFVLAVEGSGTFWNILSAKYFFLHMHFLFQPNSLFSNENFRQRHCRCHEQFSFEGKSTKPEPPGGQQRP